MTVYPTPNKNENIDNVDCIIQAASVLEGLCTQKNIQGIFIIVTGDGNDNKKLGTFPKLIEMYLQHGWDIEIYTWLEGLSGRIKAFSESLETCKRVKIFYLDNYLHQDKLFKIFDDVSEEYITLSNYLFLEQANATISKFPDFMVKYDQMKKNAISTFPTVLRGDGNIIVAFDITNLTIGAGALLDISEYDSVNGKCRVKAEGLMESIVLEHEERVAYGIVVGTEELHKWKVKAHVMGISSKLTFYPASSRAVDVASFIQAKVILEGLLPNTGPSIPGGTFIIATGDSFEEEKLLTLVDIVVQHGWYVEIYFFANDKKPSYFDDMAKDTAYHGRVKIFNLNRESNGQDDYFEVLNDHTGVYINPSRYR